MHEVNTWAPLEEFPFQGNMAAMLVESGKNHDGKQ